ncbi:MAG TPA: SPFH domain-containing protein [Flavobacteriales bacterium]|nr:SPFH domain-containing protein [Flavobacteriales bacterium]
MIEYLTKAETASHVFNGMLIMAFVLIVVWSVRAMWPRKGIMAITGLSILASCTTVSPGHKGVEIEWGGQTNTEHIYSEGMHSGLHWVWDDIVEYDVREKTRVERFEFNDANNMATGVEVSLDFSLMPEKVALIHKGITDMDTKIQKTLKSACKEVVPQYSASDLNLRKRAEAEQKLNDILSAEMPSYYVNFARIQITDVDIPRAIAEASEATAKQQELNKLAGEKAKEAENNYKAAEWDAKTKDILSQPAMLALKKLEIEELWAKKGVSPWGNNNVFGADVSMFKTLK